MIKEESKAEATEAAAEQAIEQALLAVHEKYVKSLEQFSIDEETKILIDNFLSKYGDKIVCHEIGYLYHGSQTVPKRPLTGKEAMELILYKFNERFCQSKEVALAGGALTRFIERLKDDLDTLSTKKTDDKLEIKFLVWTINFPSVRNSISEVFNDGAAEKEILLILNKLLISRAEDLLDIILLSQDHLGSSDYLFKIFAGKKVYGKDASEFDKFFEKRLEIALRNMDSIERVIKKAFGALGQIVGKPTERETLHSELKRLFEEAPEFVQTAMENQFQDFKF